MPLFKFILDVYVLLKLSCNNIFLFYFQNDNIGLPMKGPVPSWLVSGKHFIDYKSKKKQIARYNDRTEYVNPASGLRR